MAYLLDRMYIPEPAGGIIGEAMPWSRMNPAARGGWVGYADMVQALDQNIIYNLTAPPGNWTNIYYGLMGQLSNWEYNVKKVDESIEVSPMYKGFYEMVMNEKQNIEIKVKKVIDDIITHTSELELLQHDLRRYKEFYDYFDYKTEPARRKPDDHSLKAVFVDMVDYHSGESGGGGAGRLSMSFMQQNNIFPTIIQDFYQMNSVADLETNPRLSGLAKVEKDMLKTKFTAFEEWKSLFGSEVKTRYERLNNLADSKKKMIDKSADWIKPYIARHKLLKEGMSEEGGRAGRMFSEFGLSVQPSSATTIKVWAWKEFPIQEYYKTPGELVSPLIKKEASFIERDGSKYSLKDKWTMDNLILDPKDGLKNKYPFINETWVQEKVNEIMYRDDWFRARKRVLDKVYYYYAFMEITFNIFTTRTSTGMEIEDLDVSIQSYWMSRNVLLTKLLELKAKQYEFEKDIEDMLGIKNAGRDPDTMEKNAESERLFSEAMNRAGKGGSEQKDIQKKLETEFNSLYNCFSLIKEKPELLDAYVGKFLDEKTAKCLKDASKKLRGSSSRSKDGFSQMGLDIGKSMTNFLAFFGIKDFRFSRSLPGYGPPPYETSFKNRISKYYLVSLGRFYFGPISKFVRNAMMK